MQKLLICLALGASLAATGCSGSKEKSEYRTPALGKLPFVYRMTVQQGNILTEENVDRLEPGMTKSQVRYLLGTPMLEHMFHANRWDYTYTLRKGHEDMKKTRVTLFFEDDALIRVEGDLRPNPQRSAVREPGDMIVSVPDWKDDRGIFAKALDKIGVDDAD